MSDNLALAARAQSSCIETEFNANAGEVEQLSHPLDTSLPTDVEHIIGIRQVRVYVGDCWRLFGGKKVSVP